ncbi:MULTISPECIES: MBL fold metallo-hydrolase [unclassified Acinetobacter]|uniref:MBL fold metallo-hydrolase n=1 Tax=unclassified Acinetobacter TaxID=196816 RepID=UPI0035B7D5D2
MQIDFYHTGYCTHPECMVQRGASLANAQFPAMVARIRHQIDAQHQSTLLFDTGYAQRFFHACQKFPEKLYALTTPVTLSRPSIAEQLGDERHEIDTVFLSHLHADHVAGLRDFPNAKILVSKKAYDFSITKTNMFIGKFATAQALAQRLRYVKQGVLTELLPDDWTDNTQGRIQFIEDLPPVQLSADFYPFEKGYRISQDLIAIELAGHAVGHYGLLAGEFFLVADAVWRFASIAENKRANPLTSFIVHNQKQTTQSIDQLQLLHRHNPKLWLIPSHCSQTLAHLGLQL